MREKIYELAHKARKWLIKWLIGLLEYGLRDEILFRLYKAIEDDAEATEAGRYARDAGRYGRSGGNRA